MKFSKKLMALSLVCLPIACGPKLLTNKAWNESKESKTQEASVAYDKGDYAKAIELYEGILEKSPDSEEVRIQLAYSYNAVSGLRLLDLVKGFAKENEKTTNGNSTERITGFVKILGLTDAEKADYQTAMTAKAMTLEEFRARNTKMQYVSKMWKTVCRYVSAASLEKIAGTDAEKRKAFSVDTDCKGGSTNPDAKKSSVVLAAMLGMMAESAALFQTVVDKNGNNKPDIAEDLESAIGGLKTSASLTLIPFSLDSFAIASTPDELVAQVLTKITSVNTATTSLISLAEKLADPLLNQTFSNFNMVAALVASAPGVPKDVSSNIQQAVARIRDTQNVVQSFAKTALNTTGGLSEQRKSIGKALSGSSKTINTISGRYLKATGAKITANASIATAAKTMCSNFSGVSVGFAVPETVKKPSLCSDVQ